MAHPDDPAPRQPGDADAPPGGDAGQPEQAEVVGGPGLDLPGLDSLPDLGALTGGGLDGLLDHAQQLISAQAQAAEELVEGVAGGGMVRIRVTGGGLVESVTIAPEVVDPDDVAMLEDLVVAAMRDVNERLGALQRQALGGLGDLLGGGSLDDLLGGG